MAKKSGGRVVAVSSVPPVPVLEGEVLDSGVVEETSSAGRVVGVGGAPVAGAMTVGSVVSAEDRTVSPLRVGGDVAVCKAEIVIFVRDNGDAATRNMVRDMLAREVERWALETPGVELSSWAWKSWRKEVKPDPQRSDEDKLEYVPQSGDVVKGTR